MTCHVDLLRCARPLTLGLFAMALLAAEYVAPPTQDAWDKLKAQHIDQLVAYASAGGDNKSGSLELELREQAIAFARRIDSKSPKLKNLFARKRAMTKDEQEADRALRDLVATRDKTRLAEEAGAAKAAPPPTGEDLAATLERLRFVILRDQILLAKQLSLDPDDAPTVVLRKSILTQVKSAIGPTKWAWEKQSKDLVDQLLNAKYEPWNGTWVCSEKSEWGELTLTQSGATVKGTWKDGSLTGEMKGRHLIGKWTGQGTQQGEFTFSMGDRDIGFDARVTDKVGRPTHWTATNKTAITTTIIEVEEPAEPPADAPKQAEPGL